MKYKLLDLIGFSYCILWGGIISPSRIVFLANGMLHPNEDHSIYILLWSVNIAFYIALAVLFARRLLSPTEKG